MRHRPVTAVMLLFLLSAAVAPVQAATNTSSAMRALPGAKVQVRASHTDQRLRPILAPDSALTTTDGSAGLVAMADIQVTYTGFSQAAHDAFEAAVNLWETKIVSSQVIHVDAHWTSLGANTGILGSAGPRNFYLLGDGTAYPTALAESICSCELGATEIDADFNSDFGSWYLGTDGNAPSNKYDFYTVVLHELGHGLGFLSSFWVDSGQGSWGLSDGVSVYPLRFDQMEWTAATGGTTLTNTSVYPNPSGALKTELTDGSVYLGGPNVVAAYGGRAPLYAPGTWNGGSSNSHFNEASFGAGSQDALMTPFLSNGEVIHDAGPVTLAVFRDIGWSTATEGPPTEPGPPTGVSALAGNGSADVSWTAPNSDGGQPISVYTATSAPDGLSCQTAATSCTVFGLTNETAYTFTVTATNGIGTGPASDPSNSVTPSTTPADLTAPTVTVATGGLFAPQQLGTTAALRLSWPPASDASGISSYELQRRKGSGSWVAVMLASPTSTTADVALSPGSSYAFRLRATDGVGNVGPWATTTSAKLFLLQEKAAAIAYGGSWRRSFLSGSSGSYVRRTATAGRYARLTFSGSSAAFVSTLAPGRGIANVWLDGQLVAAVDLYSASAIKKAVVWAPAAPLPAGVHTIEVRVTGTRNVSATKNRVDIDAFLVWP